jgi:hypothetical protein
MTMTTVEVPYAVQNDVYDPDDFGLQDSPLLQPLKPKLQPTPSPPPDDFESEDAKPVPSQGDAVLIGLPGGGKALEVARRAGIDLLPPDDEELEVKATSGKSDYATNLEALAAGALNAVKFHKAHAATTPNGLAKLPLEEINIAPKLNGHDRNMPSGPLPDLKKEPPEDGKRYISPKLFNTQGGDELAPIQESSPKSEKVSGFNLRSISAHLGDLTKLADAATAMVGTKQPNSTHLLWISEFPLIPSMLSPAATPHEYRSSTTETPSTDQSASGPTGIPASMDGITDPEIRGFKCTHPGCTAPLFQTQSLFNSHANVHSAHRPYYCPVKGCPRGKGGKGFKRKNEMIRHGLVHESPGYVCPYCIDQEHKYPRPDNLQRSVSYYLAAVIYVLRLG